MGSVGEDTSDASRRTAGDCGDGRRPQVRTRWDHQDVSRETVAVLHGGSSAVRPARRGAAVADPGLRTADGDFFARVPASADLYLLSRVLHDWDDWPQVWTRGPAGCARRSRGTTGDARRPTPRASKPRGSPGCADRGRAPRLMPAGSDTQPTGRPWGCSGVPLHRPQMGCPDVSRGTGGSVPAVGGSGRPVCLVSRRKCGRARRSVLVDPTRQVSRGTAPVFRCCCSRSAAVLPDRVLGDKAHSSRATAATYVGAASRRRSLSPPTRSATASAAALPVAATIRTLFGCLERTCRRASRRGVRHQPA